MSSGINTASTPSLVFLRLLFASGRKASSLRPNRVSSCLQLTASFCAHSQEALEDTATDRQTSWQAAGQTDRQEGRKADRQTGRKTDQQTEGQAGSEAGRQTGRSFGLGWEVEPCPAARKGSKNLHTKHCRTFLECECVWVESSSIYVHAAVPPVPGAPNTWHNN